MRHSLLTLGVLVGAVAICLCVDTPDAEAFARRSVTRTVTRVQNVRRVAAVNVNVRAVQHVAAVQVQAAHHHAAVQVQAVQAVHHIPTVAAVAVTPVVQTVVAAPVVTEHIVATPVLTSAPAFVTTPFLTTTVTTPAVQTFVAAGGCSSGACGASVGVGLARTRAILR